MSRAAGRLRRSHRPPPLAADRPGRGGGHKGGQLGGGLCKRRIEGERGKKTSISNYELA